VQTFTVIFGAFGIGWAAIILWQGVVVTIVAAAFALVPSVNQAYWILSATVTALLAFYYLPIFAAVIRLRYTQPDAARPFRIPGGKAGVWIVAGTGFTATTFAVLVALQRPGTVTAVSDGVYVAGMIALALVWMVPWVVFVVFRRTAWLTSARGSAGPR
jgi:amino acid transporter